MDYIQEELRRQRETLAALLLGGGVRQTSEGDREENRLPTGALPTVSSAVHSAEAERTAAGQAAMRMAAGPAGARRPRFTAEGGIAAEASAPADWDGVLSGGWTAGLREETAATAAAHGGAGLAVPWERNREILASGEVKLLWDGQNAAEVSGDGWTGAASAPPAAGRSLGTSAAERTVTELVYPADGGTAVTAEALSRAFQRDARRYDGGFVPY